MSFLNSKASAGKELSMKSLHSAITSLALCVVISTPAQANGLSFDRQSDSASQVSSFLRKWFERYLVDRLKTKGWSCQHASEPSPEPAEPTEVIEPEEPTEPVPAPLEFNFKKNDFKDRDWHSMLLTNLSNSRVRVVFEFNKIGSEHSPEKLEVVVHPGTKRETIFVHSFPDERAETHDIRTSVKVMIPEGAQPIKPEKPIIVIEQIKNYDPEADIEPRSNGTFQCWETHCKRRKGGGTKHQTGPDYD